MTNEKLYAAERYLEKAAAATTWQAAVGAIVSALYVILEAIRSLDTGKGGSK